MTIFYQSEFTNIYDNRIYLKGGQVLTHASGKRYNVRSGLDIKYYIGALVAGKIAGYEFVSKPHIFIDENNNPHVATEYLEDFIEGGYGTGFKGSKSAFARLKDAGYEHHKNYAHLAAIFVDHGDMHQSNYSFRKIGDKFYQAVIDFDHSLQFRLRGAEAWEIFLLQDAIDFKEIKQDFTIDKLRDCLIEGFAELKKGFPGSLEYLEFQDKNIINAFIDRYQYFEKLSNRELHKRDIENFLREQVKHPLEFDKSGSLVIIFNPDINLLPIIKEDLEIMDDDLKSDLFNKYSKYLKTSGNSEFTVKELLDPFDGFL